MRTDKGHGMEECAADSLKQRDLRRVLRLEYAGRQVPAGEFVFTIPESIPPEAGLNHFDEL